MEVVSPNDRYPRVRRKVREYLEKGVRLIWVVDPVDRSVTVYRSLEDEDILTETETLEGCDVLPGFSCRVADFLPPLPAAAP